MEVSQRPAGAEQELLEAVLATTGDGVFSVDTAGRVLRFNPRAAHYLHELYGVEPGPGLDLGELIRSGEQGRRAWDTAVGGRPTRIRIGCGPGNAGGYQLDLRPLPEQGGLLGMISRPRDDTLNTLQEENVRLADEVRFLRAALNASTVGIFQWNIEQDEVVWDENLHRLFGRQLGQAPRTAAEFIALIHPDDAAEVSGRLEEGVCTGGPIELLFRILRPDGEERWIQDHSRLHTLSDGTVCLTGACADVTGLQNTAAALERAVLARDRFLAIASHELRTPLTTLGLNLDLARRQMLRDDTLASLRQSLAATLDRCQGVIRPLARLVADFGEVARAQEGRLVLQPAEVDLGALAAQALDVYAVTLDQAGCTVGRRIEYGVTGHWDPQRLQQVLANLLSNCVRYAPGAHVEVEVQGGQRWATLTVTDDGPGIAPPDQDKVFQRFGRAAAAGVEGLGLGLYLVRELVQAHDGSIVLESAPGRGARFTIRLPRRQPAPAA